MDNLIDLEKGLDKTGTKGKKQSFYNGEGNDFAKIIIIKYYNDALDGWDDDEYVEEGIRWDAYNIEFDYPGIDDKEHNIRISKEKFYTMLKYFFTNDKELIKDEKNHGKTEEEMEEEENE